MDAKLGSASTTAGWSEALQALARRGAQSRSPNGTRLITEGDLGDTLYIVQSGRVKAFSTDERGREITYGVYGPGEYLGEMSLDGGPRSASVTTLEATVCSIVTRQTLREHIAEFPEFALELVSRVIRRARVATQSARNMALLDVYGRVVQLIDDLAEDQADGTRIIAERLTQSDIAARVGCSREMVARLMKDLRDGGFIETRGATMLLLKRLPAKW